MLLFETETGMRLIIPALQAEGWNIQSQIRRELTFANGRLTVRGRRSHRGEGSRADCPLYRSDIPRAVIEAKKDRLGSVHGIQLAFCENFETSPVRAKTTREQFATSIAQAVPA